MRIRLLSAFIVRLPLKRTFKHASAARDSSENVVVRCELTDGTAGWGEGVPRSYVTGETPEGCLQQLAATRLAEQLAHDCADWPAVVTLCAAFQPTIVRENPRGCYGNALRCAVELAMLDAYGQLFHTPISSIAKHTNIPLLRKERSGEVLVGTLPTPYSAIIDSGNNKLWRKSFVRRLYGFRHCKVKVGAAGDNDVARLQTIRSGLGSSMDVRLDANEAWHAEELLAKLEPLKQFNISCVEQPVPHEEVSALAELRRQVDIPIMLDESLTSEIDARAAIAGRWCEWFNIRLSKCGGFLASLRLAALAESAGIGYQLGCHPGETGILSAAGRQWATVVPNVRYLEGSYDRFLFRRRLTNEDLTFGFGGRAPAIRSPGLGVTINTDVLREVTLERRDFPIA